VRGGRKRERARERERERIRSEEGPSKAVCCAEVEVLCFSLIFLFTKTSPEFDSFSLVWQKDCFLPAWHMLTNEFSYFFPSRAVHFVEIQ
jgi:hypothetical protein